MKRKKLPSISKVIWETKPDFVKERIKNWELREGAEKVKAVRSRGVNFHQLVELYFNDLLLCEEDTGNDYFDVVLSKLERLKPDFRSIEENFSNYDLGYCGRPDLLTKFTIEELKTREEDNLKDYHYEDYSLQCGALWGHFRGVMPVKDVSVIIVLPTKYEVFMPEYERYFEKFMDKLKEYNENIRK